MKNEDTLPKPWTKCHYFDEPAYFWTVDIGAYVLNVIPQDCKWLAVIDSEDWGRRSAKRAHKTIRESAKKAVEMMQDEISKMEKHLNAVAKATGKKKPCLSGSHT